MRIQGEASAARESIMKGRNVLTDEDEATTTSRRVAVAFAVAVYDPAKHPSRSRSPCSGLRVVAPRRVRPRLAHHVTYYVARSSIVLSHSHHLRPAPAHHPSSAPRRRSTLSPPPYFAAPSFFVARSLVLAPAPTACVLCVLRPWRQWRGAGERSSDDSPSADCGGRVVQCLVVSCAPMSLVISSRCKSTACNSPRDAVDVSSAWHGRSRVRPQGGREEVRQKEREGKGEGGEREKEGRAAQELAAPPCRSLTSCPSTTLLSCCFLAAGDPSESSSFVGVLSDTAIFSLFSRRLEEHRRT